MILTSSFEKTSPIQGAFAFGRYLHQCGEGVTFAALDSNDRARQSLLPEIQRCGLSAQSFEMTGWPGLIHITRVRDYVRKNSIDAVISYSLRPEIANACLSGVMRVSAVREILREQFALSYDRVTSRVLSELRLKVLRKLDGILVLTEAMGEHLAENGIDPNVIHQVNNFVDVEEVRGVLKEQVEPKDADVHIGYFGFLNRRKRVDIALRAVRNLVYDYGHKNIKFHIAGDGPLGPQLMRLTYELGLNEETIFHGYLGSPFALMKKMDLVVLTSEGEGLPRCLMEAMSLGKTCIAADIPGMSELIRHSETGYLFRKGDVEGLSSLLHEIIESKRHLPPDELYRYMLEHFDINSCAGKMLGSLQEIARWNRKQGFEKVGHEGC